MIKRFGLILGIFLLCFAGMKAQMCEQALYLKEGVDYTFKNYDPKGKHLSTNKHKVLSSEAVEEGTKILLAIESTNHKGKEISNEEVEISCIGNTLIFDLRSLINPQNMKGFEEMEIKVEENKMVLPADLEEGKELEEGILKLIITSEGQHIATIDLKVFNRVVEGRDSVKTEAGTFETWKIKYDMEMVTTTIIPLKIHTSGIDWYSSEAGTVKTESYNRYGKLTGYSLLTEVNF